MVDTCVICQRRGARVCDTDRQSLAAQLRDLPGNIAELTHQLVPTAAPGERVTLARTTAPIPARVDALSMVGPGSEDVEWMPALLALHPQVRHWTTRHTLIVERELPGGGTAREPRTIVEWHRGLVVDEAGWPVLVDDGDQVGIIPPREWLDVWVRRWRLHFGHHVPSRTFRPQPPGPPPAPADAGEPPDPVQERADREQARIEREQERAEQERQWRTVLGIGPALPVPDRPDDPLGQEWTIRFGNSPRYASTFADVRYLLTWLDHACQTLPDIDLMAAELRALTGELSRVLGKIPDQQWIGRCPTFLVIDRDDEEGEQRRACGASLWQDPHASQIQCPRCRSTWGPNALQLFTLARDIRKVWPLDRRRRYSTGEREAATAPCSSGCGNNLTVTWSDVTAPRDRQRWWRISRVSCPAGCRPSRRQGVCEK